MLQMWVPSTTPSWHSHRRLLIDKLNTHSDLRHAQQLHALAVRADLHRDPYVAPKLIAAFSLCRRLALAVKVFDQIPEPNAHLYTTLIRAHLHNSHPDRAVEYFLAMLSTGVSPDNFTYPFVLKACCGEAWLPVIHMIHARIVKCGFAADIYVQNSLIDCYCKSGSSGVTAAGKVFTAMQVRDIVSWTTMIVGLLRFGEVDEGRQLFDEMPDRDLVSWNTMLDGYVKAGKMNEAFEFFQRMPERDVVSWSTVVNGYTKSGDMYMARLLFNKMPDKNLVTWTIMVSAYAKRALLREASELYHQMREAGFKLRPDTAISILSACSESGLLRLGQKVHTSVGKNPPTRVSIALIDMYSKCGSLEAAEKVFDETREKDLVTWNAMLHGIAVHGLGNRALRFFSRMKDQGFSPDSVTFISLLCAFSRAGFVEEGLCHFHAMERDYGITPQVAHYGCVIGLLGRAGRLEEAFRIVKTMPVEPDPLIWGTLLRASKRFCK